MTVANLLRQTVDQVNTPYTVDGSAKYYRLLTQLADQLGVENPWNFDEVSASPWEAPNDPLPTPPQQVRLRASSLDGPPLSP